MALKDVEIGVITVILALVVLVLTGFVLALDTAGEVGPSPTITVQESDMIQLTNEYRDGLGLSKLTINDKLMTSAREKADTLCRTGEWSHEAGNEPFSEPIKRAGYRYTKAGENLARRHETVPGAFEALKASPTHHENIIGAYNDIGVGYSFCGGDEYIVMHYGRVW